MRIALMMALCFGVTAILLGQDQYRPIKEAVVHQKMLERIEALEKRIDELESKLNQKGESRTKPRPPIHPVPSFPTPYSPPPSASVPDHYRAVPANPQPHAPQLNPPQPFTPPSYVPPRPYQPQRKHDSSRPKVATPPTSNQGVPKSWKRFEFNGQYYYIVPADQAAERLKTHQ